MYDPAQHSHRTWCLFHRANVKLESLVCMFTSMVLILQRSLPVCSELVNLKWSRAHSQYCNLYGVLVSYVRITGKRDKAEDGTA